VPAMACGVIHAPVRRPNATSSTDELFSDGGLSINGPNALFFRIGFCRPTPTFAIFPRYYDEKRIVTTLACRRAGQRKGHLSVHRFKHNGLGDFLMRLLTFKPKGGRPRTVRNRALKPRGPSTAPLGVADTWSRIAHSVLKRFERGVTESRMERLTNHPQVGNY